MATLCQKPQLFYRERLPWIQSIVTHTPRCLHLSLNHCQCKHVIISLVVMAITALLLIFSQSQRVESSTTIYPLVKARLMSSGSHINQLITDHPTLHDMNWEATPDDAVFQCQPNDVVKQFKTHLNLDKYHGCQRLIYNRVPKCGSRSILSTFTTLAHQSGYFIHKRARPVPKKSYFEDLNDLASFAHNFSQYEEPFLYSQHVHFVNFTQLGVPPPMFINVIRDPVARVVSHYYFNKFGSMNAPQDISTYKTLDDCIAMGDDGPWLPIHQVLPFFCGQTKACRRADMASLQQAKRNVQSSFLVVGLTEDIPGFLALLEILMPQFFTNATTVFNQRKSDELNRTKTVYKPELLPHTKQALQEILKYEYDFYNYIRQRFYTLQVKIRSLLQSAQTDFKWRKRREIQNMARKDTFKKQRQNKKKQQILESLNRE